MSKIAVVVEVSLKVNSLKVSIERVFLLRLLYVVLEEFLKN